MVKKNEPIDGTEYTRWIYRTSPVNSADNDAFGRLRVSTPYTVFDSKNVYNDTDIADTLENQPLIYDNQEVSGTGTSTTYNPNQSSQTLTVSEETAGSRVRQTFRRFNYQSAKSQLHFNSFIIGNPTDGIIKREGFFDDKNGMFLECSDDVYFVIRSYTSGTAVDRKFKQSEWNIDKLDGTTTSGITLDLTKTQILIIDFEWLGVGRVRFGFVIDGKMYIAHEVNNANNMEMVYATTPNLPVRSEITNDGTGIEDSITQICSSVISEGGQEDTGIIRYVSTAGTALTATTENVVYALLVIRLKENFIGETIKQINASLQIQSATDKIEWILYFNPTIAGTLTFNPITYSAIEYAVGTSANTITGGYQVTGGFLESGGTPAGAASSSSRGLQNALSLGSKIDGTRDTFVLAVRPIGGSSGVLVEGGLTWRELS